MLRLLQIEWMKVKNYRTFWILLAITIVGMPAFNYTVYDLSNNSFPKIKGKSILGTPFSFPDVWQTVSWNSSLLLIIPAVLIITLTTNEFTYKTHRQNVIDGWSRSQFINVKLVEVFIIIHSAHDNCCSYNHCFWLFIKPCSGKCFSFSARSFCRILFC